MSYFSEVTWAKSRSVARVIVAMGGLVVVRARGFDA
jgi:hypothetical protein